MRVLILNGSPRPNGRLEEAGHEFDELDICRMNVHGCLACEYCHGKGNGQCVQKDDMGKVYHALGEADMLVIASPIYYHGLTGQLKCCMDRFYAALYPKKPMKLAKVGVIPDQLNKWLADAEGVFESFELDCTLHNLDATDFFVLIASHNLHYKLTKGMVDFQDDDTRNRMFKTLAKTMTPNM